MLSEPPTAHDVEVLRALDRQRDYGISQAQKKRLVASGWIVAVNDYPVELTDRGRQILREGT
ncbi:MAG: hypothetical protein ACREU5_06930 [Burkholderiales bacterium]